MWDLKTGTHLYDLPPHSSDIHCTVMADSGRLAITGSSSPSLTVWDSLSPPVQHTTRLHTGEDISTVALSGCGGLGVSTSHTGSICVFDTEAMSPIRRLQPHSAAVTQVLVYKDGNKLFSASKDGTLCLWNGETGEILTKFEENNSSINCMAITGTKDLLMTGAEDGEVAFWSIETGKKLRMFSEHTSGVLTVAFISQSKDQFMLSASHDGSLSIREFHSSKVVVSTLSHSDDLVSTGIAPNSMFMVSGSRTGLGYAVSLPHGTLMATLVGHTASITSLRVFPDSSRCVTGSRDQTIRVWTIDDARCTAVLHTDEPVLACDVNYNNIILYGTEGGWVSTAAYQSDLSKPNTLVSQLNIRDSPEFKTGSSSSATPTPPHSRADLLPHDENNKSTNHFNSSQKNQPSPVPQPEVDATATEATDFGGTSGREKTSHTVEETGEAAGGGVDDVIDEASRSAGGSDNGSGDGTVSTESVAHTATGKSSTCTIL